MPGFGDCWWAFHGKVERMRRIVALLSLYCFEAFGQVSPPPCAMPTLYAVVAGWQGQSPPITVYFLCSGLAALPALMGFNCPGPLTVPATARAGEQLYIGLAPADGQLHLASASFAVGGCNPPSCYQDWTPMPYVGEYTVAVYTVGSGIKPTWTGAPAQPVVKVIGNCNAIVTYAPDAITVTCQ